MIFDMFSDDFKRDPWDVFRRLRAEAPVAKANIFGDWAVAKHHDVKAIMRNPRLYSNKAWKSNTSLVPELAGSVEAETMLSMDPPHHTRLRKIVAPIFVEKNVNTFEDKIRGIVRELRDDMMKGETCNFVEQFSLPLPMSIISDLLGVEKHRSKDFKRWTHYTTNLFPFLSLQGEERAARIEKVKESQKAFTDYMNKLITERQTDPKDDLLSMIAQAKVDGESLSMMEMNVFSKLLLVAGNETTQNAIGNIMILFKEQPQVLRQLQDNPHLLDDYRFVDEALRFRAPVYLGMRTPTKEVEIRGVTIKPGERIVALTASADHDEEIYKDPQVFNPFRENLDLTMPFGHGVHICLGMYLARLEIKIAYQELLEVIDDLVIEDFEYLPAVLVRGPGHLNLRRRRKSYAAPAQTTEESPPT